MVDTAKQNGRAEVRRFTGPTAAAVQFGVAEAVMDMLQDEEIAVLPLGENIREVVGRALERYRRAAMHMIEHGRDPLAEALDKVKQLEADLVEAKLQASIHKEDHENACKAIAEMFHAATGTPWGNGPTSGVVEDVRRVAEERMELLELLDRGVVMFRQGSPTSVDAWLEQVERIKSKILGREAVEEAVGAGAGS